MLIKDYNQISYICAGLDNGLSYGNAIYGDFALLPWLSINQSINQLKFYSANFPGEARLSGVTAESWINSKIDEAVP